MIKPSQPTTGSRPGDSQGKGLLLVVSSPSGAGKTTLCRRLVGEFEDLRFSISYTTRARRGREAHGVDYYFVGDGEFDRMIDRGEFAEWAHVHGHRYGTARATIDENLSAGCDVLFDIDWQGATALKTRYETETVMVFILPPSMDELAGRLRRRGTNSDAEVAGRLDRAREELGHYGEYHYLVVNDDLELAYRDLRAIYLAAHCTRARRAAFAEQLRKQARATG